MKFVLEPEDVINSNKNYFDGVPHEQAEMIKEDFKKTFNELYGPETGDSLSLEVLVAICLK